MMIQDVLNRMRTETWRSNKGLPEKACTSQVNNCDLRPGDRNEALEARHLSKYVFPLQYGMTSAFSYSERLPEQLMQRSSFIDREFEIEVCLVFLFVANALVHLLIVPSQK